jgi:hypothetical protein
MHSDSDPVVDLRAADLRVEVVRVGALPEEDRVDHRPMIRIVVRDRASRDRHLRDDIRRWVHRPICSLRKCVSVIDW